MAYRCARIWWRRPVWGFNSNREARSFDWSTRNRVRQGLPVGVGGDPAATEFPEGQGNLPVPADVSENRREIGLPDQVFLKGPVEDLMGLGVLGEDNHSAGFPVETVHHPGLPAQVFFQQLDEGQGGMGAAFRHHRHPGGLGDDKDLVVFV